MWYVYMIRDPQRVVYVGLTSNITQRCASHRRDGAVGAWAKALHAVGIPTEMVTVAYFETKSEAAESERRLIAAIPNLLNKRVNASSGRPLNMEPRPWEEAGVSRATWYRRKKGVSNE